MKTGDIVKCLDNSKYPNFLTVNSLYSVMAVRELNGVQEILLVDNMGGMMYFESALFAAKES